MNLPIISCTPKPGFTLAELLIALALLGIIAAFTIPKVLQANAEQERVAKLRETVATLEDAWYSLKMKNQLTPGFLYQNVYPIMNCVEHNPTANFCTMPNGVEIVMDGDIGGLEEYLGTRLLVPQQTGNTLMLIDLNGMSNPPNQVGQDRFQATFNPWGDFDYTAGAVYSFGANNKNFHWGSTADPTVYDEDGDVSVVSPDQTIGYWLTR